MGVNIRGGMEAKGGRRDHSRLLAAGGSLLSGEFEEIMSGGCPALGYPVMSQFRPEPSIIQPGPICLRPGRIQIPVRCLHGYVLVLELSRCFSKSTF